MEKKYYTPQIEEFHIGFEYEIKGGFDNKWITEVFSLEHTWYHTHNKFPIHFRQHIMMGQIRVKCLDKEDIESLGWKYVIPSDGKYLNDNYYSIIKDIPEPNKTTIEFKLRVIGDNISIWSDDTDSTYFDGIIKNKAELKKIMQQINLNN